MHVLINLKMFLAIFSKKKLQLPILNVFRSIKDVNNLLRHKSTVN